MWTDWKQRSAPVPLPPDYLPTAAKRQVKSLEVYLTGSELLHALLDLPERVGMESRPTLGASWEGRVIAQVVALTGARADRRFFWATHGGAELDLLIVRGGHRLGWR